MPPKQNPTATGDRVSWNALDSASIETPSLSKRVPQLPPIIARHLWRPEELAAIEAAAMLAIALFGGANHG